jgi:hypothetical protein
LRAHGWRVLRLLRPQCRSSRPLSYEVARHVQRRDQGDAQQAAGEAAVEHDDAANREHHAHDVACGSKEAANAPAVSTVHVSHARLRSGEPIPSTHLEVSLRVADR